MCDLVLLDQVHSMIARHAISTEVTLTYNKGSISQVVLYDLWVSLLQIKPRFVGPECHFLYIYRERGHTLSINVNCFILFFARIEQIACNLEHRWWDIHALSLSFKVFYQPKVLPRWIHCSFYGYQSSSLTKFLYSLDSFLGYTVHMICDYISCGLNLAHLYF